jgi:hypothetical protein
MLSFKDIVRQIINEISERKVSKRIKKDKKESMVWKYKIEDKTKNNFLMKRKKKYSVNLIIRW